MGSAIPLCRRPFPRLGGLPDTGFDGHSQVIRSSPLCEFRLPWSFSQRSLAVPPKRSGPSHGLCFPTAREGSKVHDPRALPARCVPPAGFGYPLDGLLPSTPRRLCFAPAALLGFALRSFLLPQGIRALPPGSAHVPFLPPSFPPPKRRAGPTGRGFWVLTLAGVPRDPACV